MADVAIEAAPHKTIVKKRTKKFIRIQSDLFKRVKPSWRRCRGIDSRFRRKYRGTPSHPSPGFGSDRATKFMLPNGFKPYLVHNEKDLDALFTQNGTYAAVIGHAVGRALRRKIEETAAERRILVVNGGARQVRQEADKKDDE
jgi:large subunit ribosomal protein L32e